MGSSTKEEDLHDGPEDDSGHKNAMEDNEENSKVQKGRFYVENQQSSNITETQSGQLKKGRFEITNTMSADKNRNIYKFYKNIDGSDRADACFEVLDYQNRQIELLFDMIRNFAGEDKLFHKEFITLANEVYEKLEAMRRARKN